MIPSAFGMLLLSASKSSVLQRAAAILQGALTACSRRQA